MNQSILLLLCGGVFAVVASGAPTVVFHSEPGAAGMKLVHAPGADELVWGEGAGKVVLKKAGAPRVLTENPDFLATKGSGAVLFDGKKDGYAMARALAPASRHFLLQAWVMAEEGNAGGLHAVAAHGDGARGYILGQQAGQWVVFVGGVGAVAVGPVETGKWVHLAAHYEKGRLISLLNGRQTGERQVGWNGLNANFSIGATGAAAREAFHGKIAAVRLTDLSGEGLNVARDMMSDAEAIKKEAEAALQAQQAGIAAVLQAPGVETVKSLRLPRQERDWLVESIDDPVRVLGVPGKDGTSAELVLTNGLVERRFLLSDNLACVSYRNLFNGAEFVRSVQPEARIQLDGTWYEVGGLQGQKLKAYLLRDWFDDLKDDGKGFSFVGIETGTPKKRYAWKPRFNSGDHAWPPEGVRVTMTYRLDGSDAKPAHRGTLVKVHYELYRGVPVICKYLEFGNNTGSPVKVDRIETEILTLPQDQLRHIHMESDFSHALFNRDTRASDTQHLVGAKINSFMSQGGTTKYRVEQAYHFYATHNQAEDKLLDFPHHNVMVSTIPVGPAETITPGGKFTSMHSFEILYDGDDEERQSLAYRRAYRVIAPQVNESLLSAFISSTNPAVVNPYIDRAAELGFECLSMQFPGVRIAHDNVDPKHITHFKGIADHARDKAMIVGAYELVIASRNRGAPHNVVHPETGKPGGFFGQSACVGSEWWQGYEERCLRFLDQTGFGMWDIDGPYHGEPCGSTSHPGHEGLDDSQWRQWQIHRDFLGTLMARDQFLPIPEWCFLVGQSVTSMGYREAAAGLPANLQLLLYRQYIYDGTWWKNPNMGWIEFNLGKVYPFEDHQEELERWLVQGLGCGARINWRGVTKDAAFWDDATEEMVKGWFGWYHRHRDILRSDLIHLARPLGRDLDAIFHVNPKLQERGLAVVFNPLERDVTQEFELPLYFTGIRDKARVLVCSGHDDQGEWHELELDRAYTVRVPVSVPAQEQVWLKVVSDD